MLIMNMGEKTPIVYFSKPLLLTLRNQYDEETAIHALHREICPSSDFSLRFIRAKRSGRQWEARSDCLSIESEYVNAKGTIGWQSSSCLYAKGWTRQEAAIRFFQQLFVPGLYHINQERSPLRHGETPVSTIIVCQTSRSGQAAVLKGTWQL